MQDLNYNSAGNTGWYTQDSPWNYSPPTYGDTETSGGFNSWDWNDYANDPRFLKLIGFEGSPFISGNVGDSGGNQGDFGLSPEFLEKANQFERRQMTGDNWGGTLSSLFKNGQEVSSMRKFDPYYEGKNWDIAEGLVASAIMPGGWAVGTNTGIGAGLGLSGAAALGVNAAFNSGIMAAGSGAEDRDIGRAMLSSGAGAFLPNMGEFVGIENPNLQRAFNGGITGAGVAKLNDGDVETGAAMGAASGLGAYLGGRFMDTSYVPTNSGQQLINETNQSSMIPRNSFSLGNPNMTPAPSYVPQSSPLAYTASNQSGFQMSDLGDFFGKLMPQSPDQWGNLAEGLGGLLLGGMQYRRARKQEKELGGRRGAYETNLRRQLTRRDAASGRRSNYSGRETQLQAALAELDSRNAPAMMNLNNQQFAGLADMFRSGIRYAGKQGVFGEQFTPGYRAPSSLPPSSYLTSLGTGGNLPNVNTPITDWADDPTQNRRFRLGGM